MRPSPPAEPRRGVARFRGLIEPRPSTSPSLGAGLPWVTLGGLVVLVLLVLVGTHQSTVWRLGAVGVALFLVLLSTVGAEALGWVLLMGCYFTAPMYKGLAPSPDSTVTLTDALLAVSFVLLLPRMVRGMWPRLPMTYVVGIALCLGSGLLAAAHTAAAGETLLHLGFWFTAILVLPVALAALRPGRRLLIGLAGSYVAGQLFDTVWAIVHDGTDRWMGLSTQPNYFGQAALLSCMLLIVLVGLVPTRHRWIVVAAAVACIAGVVLSGSRAATIVLAVVVLCVPFAERAGRVTIGVALGVATAAVIGVYAVPLDNSSSALGRLAGLGTSAGSDLQRSQGLHDGLQQFLAHPLLGNGMTTDILFNIHNGLLEAAVSIGLLGLIGYMLVQFSFIHLLFTTRPLRRLGYPALAFLGFGATVPGLYDRSVWLVVALGMVAWQSRAAGGRVLSAYPPADSAVGSPARSSAGSPAHSSAHSRVHAPAHASVHSPVHSPAHSPAHSQVHASPRSSAGSLADSSAALHVVPEGTR